MMKKQKQTEKPEENTVQPEANPTPNPTNTTQANETPEVDIFKTVSEIGMNEDDYQNTAKKTSLEQSLEEARASSKKNWEQILRMQAEIQNLKKRQQRELENAHKFALENFVRDLLEVIDTIELSGITKTEIKSTNQATNEETANLKEGIRLTYKVLFKTLEQNGVKIINPEREIFDPNLHEAINSTPDSGKPANTIFSVAKVGISLNGRLIRPALVSVAL